MQSYPGRQVTSPCEIAIHCSCERRIEKSIPRDHRFSSLVCHHSASLVMQNGVPWDGFFYPTHTPDRFLYSRTPDRDFRRFYLCEINRIHHWCSVGTENPNPRAHRSSEKRGLPSFPLNGGPEGWDFSWNH